MKGFDHIAPFYSCLERLFAFGMMRRCRDANLACLRGDERVLCLGEGDGSFLASLLRRHPGIRVVCVDSSGEMLNRARKRIPRHAQVDFLQADVLTLAAAPGTFDVVVANFFFDCFTETQLSHLAQMIAETLRVGGKLLIADFRIPPSGIAYFVGKALIGSLYRFFSLTCGLTNKCLIPPDQFLESAGFKKVHRKTSCGGLLHSEVWISEKARSSSC